MVELVLKRLLKLVPDGTLCVSSADVERHFVHALHPVGNLGSAQDESHLRPVAMTDGEVPACLHHVGKVRSSVPEGFLLVLDGLMLCVADERVAADGNHCTARWFVLLHQR